MTVLMCAATAQAALSSDYSESVGQFTAILSSSEVSKNVAGAIQKIEHTDSLTYDIHSDFCVATVILENGNGRYTVKSVTKAYCE
jgi:hypothetical protein